MSELSNYNVTVDTQNHVYSSSRDLYYLKANISITVHGSDAVLCVETESAAAFKLILRDQRHVRDREKPVYSVEQGPEGPLRPHSRYFRRGTYPTQYPAT